MNAVPYHDTTILFSWGFCYKFLRKRSHLEVFSTKKKFQINLLLVHTMMTRNTSICKYKIIYNTLHVYSFDFAQGYFYNFFRMIHTFDLKMGSSPFSYCKLVKLQKLLFTMHALKSCMQISALCVKFNDQCNFTSTSLEIFHWFSNLSNLRNFTVNIYPSVTKSLYTVIQYMKLGTNTTTSSLLFDTVYKIRVSFQYNLAFTHYIKFKRRTNRSKLHVCQYYSMEYYWYMVLKSGHTGKTKNCYNWFWKKMPNTCIHLETSSRKWLSQRAPL